MTAAVRDLHLNHPDRYITEVRTSAGEIWENNSYITEIDLKADEVEVESEYKVMEDGEEKIKLVDINKVRCELKKVWKQGKVPRVKIHYPLIHTSGKGPSHFTEGYTDYLEQILDIRLRDRLMKGHIEVSDDEKSWVSQIHEATGIDDYFWIVVNGGKTDFTAKWWDPVRMQRVVAGLPNVLFVQVGQKDHYHVELRGNNVVNLIGKTDMRQLIRLVYNSSGVICPVTLMMHLAAAVPVRSDKCYGRASRPCVVLAGGREPAAWEAYTHHSYLHTCGMLPCCDDGGCWKARTEPIGDGDEKDESLCIYPEATENGIMIPKCLKMIGVEDVIHAVSGYLP